MRIEMGVMYTSLAAGSMLLASAMFSQAPTVRDSAGVEIIEYPGSAAEAREAFRLGSTPRTILGRSATDRPGDRYTALGGTVLSNRAIVIATETPRSLRYFDPSGNPIETVDRFGQGGQDHAFISAFQRTSGDTIVVLDNRNYLLSVVDPRPRLVNARWIEGVDLTWRIVHFGVFSDGTMLVAGRETEPVKFSYTTTRDRVPYFRLSRSGIVVDTLGSFPGADRITVSFSTDPGNLTVLPAYTPLFGRVPDVAVDRDHFYYFDGGAYEIARYSQDGRLRRIIRVARPNLAVTNADIEHHRRTTKSATWTEQLIANAPATMPALSRIETDVTGRVWAEEYSTSRQTDARWIAFGADGRRLGAVLLPRDRRILEWGADYALTVRYGPGATERVELLDLMAIPAPPSH